MVDNDFALEEYKFVKDRITAHEERRYQMIVLNLTAFVLVFGLTDELDLQLPLIPYILLGVLLICVSIGLGRLRLEQRARAFLIEKYERHIDDLSYQTGHAVWSSFLASDSSLLRRAREVGLNAYYLFFAFSLGGGVAYSYEFWLTSWVNGKQYITLFHLGGLVIGHLLVFHRILNHKLLRGVDEFREWWREYPFENES